MGYAMAVVAPVLMVISLWFWVDINEELADQPLWRPLPLAVKVWRWAFSGFALISLGMRVQEGNPSHRTGQTQVRLTFVDVQLSLVIVHKFGPTCFALHVDF